jgi:hypothetical protein
LTFGPLAQNGHQPTVRTDAGCSGLRRDNRRHSPMTAPAEPAPPSWRHFLGRLGHIPQHIYISIRTHSCSTRRAELAPGTMFRGISPWVGLCHPGTRASWYVFLLSVPRACELRYALFWSFACGGANCRLGSGLAGCWTLVLGRNRRHGFCPSAQLPRACSTSAAIRFVKRWKSKPRRLQVGSHIYNTSSQPT